jgi:hypothetical protein
MPIDGDKLIKELKEVGQYGTTLEVKRIPYSTSPEWKEKEQQAQKQTQRAQGISVLSGLGKSISQAALSNPVFQKLGFFGDVYQNTVGPNAPSTSKMAEALQLATMTGLTAQRIIENPEMYQDAQAEYGRAVRSAYLGGNGFSSEYIQQHYPELKTDDPVGAALALTHYKDVLNTRAIVNWATHPIQSAIETGKYIKNSWHNGEVNEEMSDVMFKAAQGEISDAEAQRQLTELNKTKIDTGGSSSIVGGTVEQVSNMLNSMGRAARTDIAPLAPVLHDLTVLAPAAVASLGYMGTAALAGAGVTGAVAGAPAAIATAAAAGLTLESSLIYDSTYRQQLGQNYWSKINARGADGSPLYTHDTAVSEAKREAHLQAAIETAFTFTAFKPLAKMFGKEAALKIIEKSVARKTMVEAGKKAFMKEAVKESAKVITYGAAEQVAQEGLEDLVTSADETITGRNPHTFKDAMRSAASAMIDAVPAAIGMMGVSGVIGGVGTYHGLTHHQEFIQAKMAKYGKESALQEVERESEANMVDHLLEARDKSKLNKEAPTQFAQVVGNQMKAQDMGTLYVDAATAVETPEGRKALGELEKSGLVTAEQVQQAVEKETPLAVDSGMYMQTVQQETADTLKEYSTFDKAGMTMHAIKEERTRLSSMAKELSKTKDEREKDAVQSIMDTYFPNETDNTKKEVLQELFAGGVDRLGDNAQEMLSNARTTWGDITGYEQYADYDPKNPPEGTSDTAEWYNEAKQAYGHNPNKRELYDVAHKEYVKESQDKSRARLEEEKQQIEKAMDDASQNGDTSTYNTLQEQMETVNQKLSEVDTNLHAVDTAKKRVEALEDIKNTLNKAGLKEDIMAKVLLSKDSYEKAYKPTVEALMQSNGNVQEAARDSALIYARMIDSLARNYKLPIENIVSTIQVTNEGPEHRTELHSPVNPDVKADTLVTVVDLTDQLPKGPLSRQELTQKVKELFANQPKMETADGKATISSPGNTRKMRHFINSSLYKVLHFRRNKEWESRHQASVLNIDKLIRNSVLIESEPNRKGDKKKDVAKYHHFYIPIKVGDKLYTARIVGEEMKGSTSINPIDVKLYDVIIAKKGTFSKATQGDLQIENVPFRITIAEMLKNVKDSNGQPYVNQDGTLAIRKDNDFYQKEEYTGKKDLIAYHNINQENLDKAIQLGGLAVPSIAVTKKETDFSNFGDITLLMPQDVVNPKETPVYTRDAWTGVFPGMVRAPKKKKLTDFITHTIMPIQKEIPPTVLDFGDMYTRSRIETASAAEGEKRVESFLQSDGAKYLYLKSLGKEPKIKTKTAGFDKHSPFTIYPRIRKAFDTLSKKYPLEEMEAPSAKGSAWERDYNHLKDIMLQEMTTPKDANEPKFRARLREHRKADIESGKQFRRLVDEYAYSQRNIIDDETFQKQLERRTETKAGKEGFHKWQNAFRKEMLDAPVIESTGKEVTLDNIVEAMLGNLKNAQKSWAGYGTGNVIAASGREITSMEDMHNTADEKIDPASSIEDDTDTSAQYQQTKKNISDFIEDMANHHYKWENTFEGYSDASQVLMGMFEGKPFSTLCREHDFKNIAGMKKRADSIVKEIQALPVKYFEAKPQRAVHFNEVAGAIVPNGTPKATIDYLKGQGVTVRRYNPANEGERHAKTEKLAKQLNLYFQKGGQYKGGYSPESNAIHLFAAADQSTMVHEAAHFYLTTLLNLEQAGVRNKQLISDLKTIRDWAGYSYEKMAEYKGTTLEKEFRQMEQDVIDGKDGAEERFLQERFARGFERYLQEGKAPTKELRGVFRRFKKTLMDIYRSIKIVNGRKAFFNNLEPVKISPEMKHIFDAMLATEDEINAWSAEQKVMEMDKVGLDFTKTEKENYDNWKSSLKDTIHEKTMRKFMDEYRELTLKGIDEITRQKKEQVMKDLIKRQKIYQVEAMLEGDVFPTEKEKMDYLKEQGFPDRKTYEEALKQAGGSLEKRAQAAAEREKEKQAKSLLSKETIRQEANRMLNSPEGAQRLAKMEAQAMRRKVNAYIRQASMALLHLEQGKKDAHLDEDIKRRLGVEGVDSENNLSLKDKLAETVENLKIARQQLDRPMNEVRYEAESLLAGQSVEKSTNWKWWQNKQRKAASMASNAARKGNWHSASYWMMKKNVYAMAARIAQRNEDEVRTAIAGKPGTFSLSYERQGNDIHQGERYGVKGILNRISRRDKPVRMSSNSRYFIQHLAYQMGLSRTDGIPPVDKNGFETEFSWNKLARELNPTAAMAADAAGNEFTVSDAEIDSRLRELFSADRPSDYRKMNLSAFKGAVEAIEVIYKLGRREYEGNSFHTIDGKDVSFHKASEAITQEIAKKFGIETDAFNEKLRASVKDELKTALTKITNAHTLPEVLIQRLGKSAEQYLYRPIDKAANVEKTMQMDAFKKFKEIFNIYSRKEWQAIRADKTIKFGRDEYGNDRYITKETLLSVALNMGTASNRERVLETYGMDTGPVLQVLDKELSAKDIRFIQAVWDHINSYWADLNAMNNRLYGRGIGKVEGIKFHLKNGELDGKYYPIRYDSETSVRTGDITINEQALQRMSGAGTFSIGMGSTKSRMLTSGGQNLITDLTVYPKHVSEVIHAIAMREASVDVYKLISDPDIKSAVVNGLGIDTYRVLRDWAQDNWKTPIERSGPLSKLIDALQSGNSYATMAFRNSTALLNILPNLGVFYRSMIRLSGDKMMEGAFRARRALASLYLTGNYAKQKEFIMEKSAFLRDRQSTLDADLERGFSLPGEKGCGKLKSLIYDGEFGKNAIDKYAFWFIEKTDLLFSQPMWLETYKATRDSYIGSNLTAEQIDAEAVAKADQMVRQYYGSGEIKDRSPVMKNKVIRMFTPFYTYSATMLNRFIESGYLAVDSHNYKPLVLDTLCLGLLVGSMDGLTRYAMNRAIGKDDSLWEEIVNSILTGNFVQGIVIVRDMVSGLVGLALGKYSDTSSEVAGFRAQENLCNAIRFMASPKKNWIDVGQALTTASNRVSHTPDTLTDALWATLRMATGDTDATLSEYLASMALDRKLKRSKEQLKKEAAERRAEKEEQDVEEPEQEESDD